MDHESIDLFFMRLAKVAPTVQFDPTTLSGKTPDEKMQILAKAYSDEDWEKAIKAGGGNY